MDSTPVPVDQASDGSFVLSSLSGTATLEITATGYEPLTVSDIAVVAGDTTSVNLRLTAVAGQKGDLDGDEYVTIADAILALQLCSEPFPSVYINKGADVNQDQRIGIEEVIYILQYVAGTRS